MGASDNGFEGGALSGVILKVTATMKERLTLLSIFLIPASLLSAQPSQSPPWTFSSDSPKAAQDQEEVLVFWPAFPGL
jgi:hypothetical protein